MIEILIGINFSNKMTSNKNKLQEYFQSKKWLLPKYFTKKVGGLAHDPLWITRIEYINSEGKWEFAMGEEATRKSWAEASAAEKVLNILEEKKALQEKRKFDGRTALLVDVENLQKFIETIYDQVDGIDIYAFVSVNSYLENKQYPESVIKVISPSNIKDGSDTCMQVYTGYLLSQNKYDKYYIATADHYGVALVDMIRSDSLLWDKKEAYIVTKFADFK